MYSYSPHCFCGYNGSGPDFGLAPQFKNGTVGNVQIRQGPSSKVDKQV